MLKIGKFNLFYTTTQDQTTTECSMRQHIHLCALCAKWNNKKKNGIKQFFTPNYIHTHTEIELTHSVVLWWSFQEFEIGSPQLRVKMVNEMTNGWYENLQMF